MSTATNHRLTHDEIIDLQLVCVLAIQHWMERGNDEQVQKVNSLHKRLTIAMLHLDDEVDEYACDRCGAYVPDGEGYYLDDDRLCANC